MTGPPSPPQQPDRPDARAPDPGLLLRAGRGRPRRRRPLWKTAALFAGTFLVVTGVPLFVTPIPVGAIMVGTGLALLLKASPHARLARRALARRLPATAARIDRVLRRRRR
jgi:hypothetical protein